jgi:hypothetical protein
VESLENQRQVFHPSHRPWKSLRDSHIPTASTPPLIYVGKNPGEAKPRHLRINNLEVGQIKLPKWAEYSCQTQVSHVTIWRWVLRYAPILNQRIRREVRHPNRSWRVDETYVRIAGKWSYLYRAVDSTGETIDFVLSPNRDLIAAKLFRDQQIRRAINRHGLLKLTPTAEEYLSEEPAGGLPSADVHDARRRHRGGESDQRMARVGQVGLLSSWNGKPSKKGTGFEHRQGLRKNQHPTTRRWNKDQSVRSR